MECIVVLNNLLIIVVGWLSWGNIGIHRDAGLSDHNVYKGYLGRLDNQLRLQCLQQWKNVHVGHSKCNTFIALKVPIKCVSVLGLDCTILRHCKAHC